MLCAEAMSRLLDAENRILKLTKLLPDELEFLYRLCWRGSKSEPRRPEFTEAILEADRMSRDLLSTLPFPVTLWEV
jgi:hypothetical protein